MLAAFPPAPHRSTTSPPRAFLFGTQRGWGGGEEAATLLMQGLIDRGLEMTAIARRGGAWSARLSELDLPTWTLPGNGRRPSALVRLRRELRRAAPCTILCNDSHAATAAAMATVGLRNVSLVYYKHTAFPIRSPRKYRWRVDQIWAVTHAVADQLQRDGIPEQQIRIVPSGITPPVAGEVAADRQTCRSELGIADAAPLVVAVGNLLACKGHRELVQAAGLLYDQGHPFHLAIAGQGPLEAELREMIRRHHLAGRVHLLGFRNDATRWLRAADLVAHPSHAEGLGFTVVRAMMLKRPVVATAAGGLAEVVGIDRRTGHSGSPLAQIVEPQDAAGLAEAIRNTLCQLPTPAQLEQAARHVHERYTDQAMCDAALRCLAEAHRKAAA